MSSSAHSSAAPSAPVVGSVERRRGWVAMAIIALATGGFGIGTTEFAIMGLLSDAVEELEVSLPQGGYLISAYALGVVVGAPVLAMVGARWPRKHMALALMILFTAANVSSYFARDYEWLLVARFVSGLPHGAYFGVAALIAASLVAPTMRARAVAWVMLGLSVANVAGVPLATWLGQQFGWRLMFIFVGVIGLLTIVLITRYVPFERAAAGSSMRTELGALKRGQVWLTLLIGIVGFGGFFAVYSYIDPTITQVTGLPGATLPLIVGLYGAGMIAGNILGGRIADRSVMGSIYVCMTAVALVLLTFSWAVQFVWPAVLMVFLVGASGATLIPALQTRLMDVAGDAQSLAASLNHAALNVANALGAFLGGVVISAGWGLTAPARVGAALAVLGLLIAFISGRLQRRTHASAAVEAERISGSR
nr:MFS transporter [Arthrobacter castelli]